VPQIKTYIKNSNHLIKLFELYSFVTCALFSRFFSLSICSSFLFKNLFISIFANTFSIKILFWDFYCVAFQSLSPPHAYLYMSGGVSAVRKWDVRKWDVSPFTNHSFFCYIQFIHSLNEIHSRSSDSLLNTS
jgi:hypothetical protein